MSSDDEMLKIKEEQIDKLNRLKELLKKKLENANNENMQLKEEIERLKQAGTPPAPSAGGEDKSIMTKLDTLFGIIIQKLDLILNSFSTQPSAGIPQPTQIPQPAIPTTTVQQTPVEQPAFQQRRPSDVLKAQQEVAEAQIPVEEPAFQQRRPSDVLKSQATQPVQPIAPQPGVPQAVEYEGGAGVGGDVGKVGGTTYTVPYPADGVVKCPSCGKRDFQEMPDKSKTPQYGHYPKKYYCKQCKTEWNFAV